MTWEIAGILFRGVVVTIGLLWWISFLYRFEFLLMGIKRRLGHIRAAVEDDEEEPIAKEEAKP